MELIFTGIVCIAALISLVLAIAKVRKLNRNDASEQEKEIFQKHASTGMMVGLAAGAVLGLIGLIPMAYGVGAGLLIGMTVGIYRK